ncbi:hypothetical protein ROHU_007388 [Labeo rohita]|uniref:Uncharacterized protein n=1 Tax=Labeo rohita TaxID=84645 RepID=A0A498LPB8_LABRO|nr:hypothetical protein ROHU_032405 [Labeo rohita]RXN19092.1 hypothetical protein ROHU_007388 [Labeo rohita]
MGPKQAVGSPHARLTLSDSLPCTAVKTAQPIPHNLTVSTFQKLQPRPNKWVDDSLRLRALSYVPYDNH